MKSAQDALRRERRITEAHAGRIENRVRNRGCARHRCGLADTERWLILTRQHQHVDLGHIGKLDDGISAPFPRRDRGALERDFLHQRTAGGLNDVAFDLVAHAFRVDHQPGILARDHARHADIAGRPVDGDVGNPCRPRRAIAGKLAVHIECIGKTAPVHDVAFLLLPDRMRSPSRALRHGIDEIDGARVLQVAQSVLDRIDAGLGGELVDVAFMRKGVWQCGDTAKPGGAHDRRHVVGDHTHVVIVIRRDRGAVAHIEHGRLGLDLAGEQQRQRRRAVGGIARCKIIGRGAAIAIQPAIDVHQLRGALGLPYVFLLARELHSHRAADRAREQ